MPNPEKAYKNLDFLNSKAARTVRILCEYEEPKARFEAEGVENTIVMFGSARIRSEAESAETLESAKAALADGSGSAEAVETAEKRLRLSRFYEQSVDLARRLTEWSEERDGPDYHICSGGGPGIMEAANRGASQVPGAKSVGLGISLPFEAGVNEYTPEALAFEFHYFFMRKLWFLYLAKAVIICPGGFGTLDEFFETLTLIQTEDFQATAAGVVRRFLLVSGIEPRGHGRRGDDQPGDTDLFLMTDSVDEAFEYVVSRLEAVERGEEAGCQGLKSQAPEADAGWWACRDCSLSVDPELPDGSVQVVQAEEGYNLLMASRDLPRRSALGDGGRPMPRRWLRPVSG